MRNAGQSTQVGGSSAVAGVASSTSGLVTIALGQTTAQVTANKGAPRQIVNLGAKQIYVYSDMKIYFVGNKVSNVQ